MRFLLSIALLISFSANAKIKIALTFDDLPRVGEYSRNEDPETVVLRILRSLERHQVHGVTAFVNGERLDWGKKSPKVIDLWIKSGHILGNHTWSHPDLHKSDVSQFIENIQNNDLVLSERYPTVFERIFRYPFLHEGETLEKRDTVRKYLFRSNYKIAQVTVDFNEYLWNAPYLRCLRTNNKEKLQWLRETLVKEATENLRGSEILAQTLFDQPIKHIALFHPFEFDSLVIDDILTEWRKMGVEFISLKEALQDPIYELDPNIRGPAWTFLNQLRISRNLPNPPALKEIYERSTELETELSKVCRP